MNRKSALSLISIAKKAGKVAAGEFQTENAIKANTASLVIVSEEASDNTKKKFSNSCCYYKVPIAVFGTKTELGNAIGCEFRASLAILDDGLAKSIWKKMEADHPFEQ